MLTGDAGAFESTLQLTSWPLDRLLTAVRSGLNSSSGHAWPPGPQFALLCSALPGPVLQSEQSLWLTQHGRPARFHLRPAFWPPDAGVTPCWTPPPLGPPPSARSRGLFVVGRLCWFYPKVSKLESGGGSGEESGSGRTPAPPGLTPATSSPTSPPFLASSSLEGGVLAEA